MNFLPVVHRELLVAARHGGHQRFRFLATLAGLAVFLLLWMSPQKTAPERLGILVFHLLGGALLAYAIVSGPLHTSDAIGTEKRAGTLGLLFLTELGGHDIVLGKLVSHSLRAVYAVVAMVPLLALPVMLGGVSGGQVTRLVLLVAVTAVFSLSLGLLASVVARDFRSALMGTILVLGLMGVGLDGGGWAWGKWRGVQMEAVRQYSPLALFRWSRAEPWQDARTHAAFRRGTGRLGVAALLFLVTASVWVRRHRDEIVTTPVAAVDEETGRAEGLIGYRQHQWSELLARHPYAWLQRVLRPVSWLFQWSFWGVVTLNLATFGAAMTLPNLPEREIALGISVVLLWALHVLLKLQVTLAATRGIAADRESGALELMVVAGQGGGELSQGLRHGLMWQYRLPLLVLLLLHFPLILWTGLPDNDSSAAASFSVFITVLIGAMLLMFDLDALVKVGIRHGLKENSPQAAFRATVLRVLAPGWIGMLPLGALLLGRGAPVSPFWVGIWMLGCLYGLHRVRKRARLDVDHGFREIVAGLPFDTDEWELRDDFRTAAGRQYPSEGMAR